MLYIRYFLTLLLQESLIVPLLSLEKQGRPCPVRGWAQLASFPENRRLCPVTAVTFYLSKVRLSCTNIALHNTILYVNLNHLYAIAKNLPK